MTEHSDADIPADPPPGGASAPPEGEPFAYPADDDALYERSLNALGIAAAVCGVIALLLCWIPFVDYLSLVLGTLAIVLGVLGVRHANAFPGAGRFLAVAGMVCGIVGFAIAAIVLLLIYTLLAAATYAP